MNDDYEKRQNAIPYFTYLNNKSNKSVKALKYKRLNSKRGNNFKLNNF